MRKFVKASNVRKFIDRVGGRFFSVQFEKVDGTIRRMACRRGVVKHLKGGERRMPDHLVGVWEPNRGYRCFDVNRVLSIG